MQEIISTTVRRKSDTIRSKILQNGPNPHLTLPCPPLPLPTSQSLFRMNFLFGLGLGNITVDEKW